jgi:hypothetical protein
MYVALLVAICLKPHRPSLHIAGQAQSPRIDKPHPASVPGTLPAVITHIMHIMHISDIIITILRIVECFQRQYECAFEGLGSSVSHSRCWEQKQTPSIPDSVWLHNKRAIIDTGRPDRDYVQAMTAVKGFGGKWIAVNRLDTLAIVFCMTKHQTVIQSKMTLASGWFLEFQCLEKSSYLAAGFWCADTWMHRISYQCFNQYSLYMRPWHRW